jgi:hypothetical protein
MYSKEYKELLQWKASLDKKDDTMQTLSDIKKMVATGQIIDELKQKEDK